MVSYTGAFAVLKLVRRWGLKGTVSLIGVPGEIEAHSRDPTLEFSLRDCLSSFSLYSLSFQFRYDLLHEMSRTAMENYLPSEQ